MNDVAPPSTSPLLGSNRTPLADVALLSLLITFCGAVLALACLSRFTIVSVWDDAYITVRYADHWIAERRLIWNAGEAPTYGVTGPLWLLIVTPLRTLLPGSPALVASLSSLACGIGATLLLGALVRTALPEGRARGLVSAVIVLASLAASAPDVATHFLSGMDTMFAVAYLSAYLLLLEWREGKGVFADVTAGLAGALAYFARPDLLLFTIAIPLVMAVSRGDSRRRRGAARILATTLAVLALELVAAHACFGSALPLSFYAKGTSLYGDGIETTYAGIATAQLRAFVKAYWFFVLPAVGAFAIAPSKWWKEACAYEKGVAAGVAAFVGYHAIFVLPVMYYGQRFYYPALPAVLCLGVLGARRLDQRLRGTMAGRSAPLVMAAVAAFGLGQTAIREVRLYGDSASAALRGRFDLEEHYARGGPSIVWPGLDRIARLPNDLVIATSEVGMPAAMNPGKRILDLAGLNHTDLALGRTSASRLLVRERPDVIYMPHADYREMTRAIRAEPELVSRYEWAASVAPPTLGVAILRDGRYAAALRSLVRTSPSPLDPRGVGR